jgi:hypothetical protein
MVYKVNCVMNIPLLSEISFNNWFYSEIFARLSMQTVFYTMHPLNEAISMKFHHIYKAHFSIVTKK